MHTQGEAGVCTFNTPEDQQTGTSNQGSTDCASGIGCSVQGKPGTYGTGFNENGGGVYAMEWTSDAINIFHFARSAIPADITEGNPNPANWGLPQAKFDSKSGDCNIDANFPRQTIVCPIPQTLFVCLRADYLNSILTQTSVVQMLEVKHGQTGPLVQQTRKFLLVRHSLPVIPMHLMMLIGSSTLSKSISDCLLL